VIGSLLVPAERAAAAASIAQSAAQVCASGAADHGRRLAAARAFVAAVDDAEQVQAMLAQRRVLGVDADPDLQWRLRERLAVLGGCSTADIDSAEAIDHTAEGAQRAARCRAALPSRQAKDAAWKLLTEPGTCSNALLYETARGFWQPSQAELTAPFVARWFDEIPATAEFRSGWVVGRVADFAFPWTAVDADTVARARALAERADVAPGVRRAALDRGDDLARALASRERFGRRVTT
jgi:aminopeptidase N